MNSVITSRIVANNERLAFLPRKMPRYYLQFENLVYDIADSRIKGIDINCRLWYIVL